MKLTREFPFHKARRVTPEDVEKGRRAIERLTGQTRLRRKGRPPADPSRKYKPISIRIHPLALAWLKKEAKKRRIPYQTIINQILLREAA